MAIVTGAGSGFGEGIAKRFVEQGAKVVIADIDERGGSRVAQALNSVFVKADVSRGSDWAKLIAETTAKFGRLDIVVNNAG
ncbi:MAG: SDR family NAD(P)-dependent oxidoreductase, partial [Burkholderiales bacterium]